MSQLKRWCFTSMSCTPSFNGLCSFSWKWDRRVKCLLKRQTLHHRGQLHYIGPLTKHQSAVLEGSIFYLTANERKTCWHDWLGSGQRGSQYSTGQYSNVICPFTTTATGTCITLLNGSTKTQKGRGTIHWNDMIWRMGDRVGTRLTTASTVAYMTCYLEIPTKEVMLNQHIHNVCFENSGFLKQHKVIKFFSPY